MIFLKHATDAAQRRCRTQRGGQMENQAAVPCQWLHVVEEGAPLPQQSHRGWWEAGVSHENPP